MIRLPPIIAPARVSNPYRARPYRQHREAVGRRGIVLIPLRGGRIILEPR
jgi:hypothetical protein